MNPRIFIKNAHLFFAPRVVPRGGRAYGSFPPKQAAGKGTLIFSENYFGRKQKKIKFAYNKN